ncbi:isocitrate lyase/PEP mutase family protein [Streptomyces sp. ET3-23]|uniref:isocitrate lyase/PEP mutase family protein n=1 Tax=Streptomyces sp. ET3-23 TaxID=2885643 RepID=UPI001D109FB8|nr:isocitrate lyase/PEP mutase family protein [Streptomyces sp. ET3-23]MCC2275238.1 isocitrate lyase/PEP mutase family protein [Streptomyces sp. ET3-23]
MVYRTYGTALREAVNEPGTTPLIGVHDMHSAAVAVQHYDGLFLSGFGLAASHYGLPDIGYIAWPDVVAFAHRIRTAFPDVHLLVDIDDGYVDAHVACHVARQLEAAGASGVILEDQKRPRRCGHVDGKQILPLTEYLDKLHAVLDTRNDLLVVARTDATDQDEILRRAAALAATDADVVLVDGVRTTDAIREIRKVTGGKPLLFNQIKGGKSPRLSLTELGELGVNIAIYSTPCLFAAQDAMDRALRDLKAADGRLPAPEPGSTDVASCLELLSRSASPQRRLKAPDTRVPW